MTVIKVFIELVIFGSMAGVVYYFGKILFSMIKDLNNKRNDMDNKRKVTDMFISLLVLAALEGSPDLFYNGIPVSEKVRLAAIDIELYNLSKCLGIKDKYLKKFGDGLDWDETSPEFREFNSVMSQAVTSVIADTKLGDSNAD